MTFMLQHADVWRGIDRLAAKYGLSPSGLAKRSGLDPTTFNRSKRVAKDGKLRWPSTESLAKILTATGASLEEFVGLLNGEAKTGATAGLRRIGYNVLAEPGFFDSGGRPIGNGWGRMAWPEVSDPNAYAVEVRGQGLMPAYADGHVLLVSPGSPVEPGDRIVMRLQDGGVLVGSLIRRTQDEVEVACFGSTPGPITLRSSEVSWMSRILWSFY